MTSARGATPYITKVMMAPRMEPWVLVASAKAISRATYIQAIATIHIRATQKNGKTEGKRGCLASGLL
ncbi:MAG: hypothetical protein A3G29_17675 [Burkholderiales bacterium RIFCSPLOWO2_12_FULL_64_99]|nr:MAG: hypothetical protein A3G29_17675 [Burkholderiales bacterium RIFCSPLOWO2_12_FULL_64_99]